MALYRPIDLAFAALVLILTSSYLSLLILENRDVVDNTYFQRVVPETMQHVAEKLLRGNPLDIKSGAAGLDAVQAVNLVYTLDNCTNPYYVIELRGRGKCAEHNLVARYYGGYVAVNGSETKSLIGESKVFRPLAGIGEKCHVINTYLAVIEEGGRAPLWGMAFVEGSCGAP